MSTDKMPEDRLFQNNTKEEIIKWGNELNYFCYLRDRGGHNCEGDSFCAYFKYTDWDDLEERLSQLGISLKTLEEGDIAFDPFESYSFDDLEKLKITISRFKEIEQPQHTQINGYKAHVWVLDDKFEISVSGSKDGQVYKVSEKDFEICRELEKSFDMLGWKSITDDDIKKYPHCISKEIYPELWK